MGKGLWSWLTVVCVTIAVISGANGAEEEKYEFQAEVSRLMDIIVNSLYSQKEIYLRELVSNAADALDKQRYLAIEDPTIMEDEKELEIRISFDEEEKTVTLRDTGIGMSHDDLVANLGTVAKSGTAQFAEAMAAGGDLNQIGQFGVGFYSVYLVADRVQVKSRKHGFDQYVWESSADSTFTVKPDEDGNTLGRGTEIKLFLKEDALEYANADRLEGLIKKHSEFITFPIYLHKSKVEMVDDEEEEDDDDDDEEEDDDEDEEDDDDDEEDEDDISTEDEEKPKKQKEVTTWSWDRVNTQAPIWTRSKDDISNDEYKEFYKSISKDYQDPLTWTHFNAEGEIEFKSILYIPGQAPFGMFDNYHNQKAALRLYVRKVLITDEFEEMPKYLNFVKGLIDSDDLPLSVSRETLQQHRNLKVIVKKLVRKVLELLRKMSEAEQAKKNKKEEDEEDDDDDDDEDEDDEDENKVADYTTFWNQFGKNVKLGVIEDTSNRNRLTKLLRYPTTYQEGQVFSLDEYIARCPEWQKSIFYIAGDEKAIKDSPFLERAKAKGVEVVLMTDSLDEYVLQQLTEYEGFKFQSLTKEGLKFGDESEEDEKRAKLYKDQFKPLAEFIKSKVDGVEKVVVSNRVTDTPAVLVTGQFGYSANMEKIMKHQAFGSGRGPMMGSKKTMEINPRHPIIARLKEKVEEDEESQEALDLAWLLFDTALLNSGFDMEEPKNFASRMYRLMQSGLKIENLDLLPEIEVPEEEENSESEEDEDAEKLEL